MPEREVGRSGYKSKRRQIQNGDNQNGDKSKTATDQNGDRPKRRHAKTATNQNGDTSKTATRQNGDTSKTATSKTATTETVHVCRRFGVSPFWICRRFGCRRFGYHLKAAITGKIRQIPKEKCVRVFDNYARRVVQVCLQRRGQHLEQVFIYLKRT